MSKDFTFFSLFSSNILCMIFHKRDRTEYYLYDVSQKTVTFCALATYINGHLLTVRNGVSRVTVDR